MKSRKSTKWDRFKASIIEFIKEKGIASMQEVYDVSNQYLHMLYATSHFEKLASFLVTNCGCFRIDLAIPNPKPLAIYPNHHKISSTTFFVLEKADDNHLADVEKAKQILKELTEAALIAENEKKKKTKKKKVNTIDPGLVPVEKEENTTKYRENQFRARDCMVNGFIPMKSVQMQMMHQFILDTFGSNPFTIQQFIDNMSLDFMSKVVGIKHIPEVLLKDIRLRHILVSCLPKRIQDQIQLSEAPQVLSQNFKRISDFNFGRFGRQFLTKINDDTYQLFDSIKINFLDKFEVSYNFTSQEQVNEFHFMLQIVDLLENIDPHSYSLWLKRYSIEGKLRCDPTCITRKIIDMCISFPYNVTFPFFFSQVERFISLHGQNWCNLKSTLLEFFQNEDNKSAVLSQCMYPSIGPIDDFCNNKALKPEPFTLFSKITSKDFESQKNDENGNHEDENKNYYDPNLFFNFLSAIMKLFPSGFITSMNDMWEKAMSIFTEVTGVQTDDFLRGNTPEALHFILRSKFVEYRDLCAFSTANESIKVRKFDQPYLLSRIQEYKKKEQCKIEQLFSSSQGSESSLQLHLKTIRKQFMLKSEIFELTTTEYLDRFNTNKLRYVLSLPTAEMVERLKILSLTPLELITVNQAKYFLSEIEDFEINNNDKLDTQQIPQSDDDEDNYIYNNSDYSNSTVVNGVLFLKLSNFFSKRVSKFKRANHQFLRNGLNCELYTITPSIVFKNIIYFFNELRNRPFNFSSTAEINCGSLPFFLDEKMPITLDLEYGWNGKSKNKRRGRPKKNIQYSDEDEIEGGDFDTENEDNDESDDDLLIDSSYLLNKLSNYSDRRAKVYNSSNLSSIVKKLRIHDSVTLKINGLLLPSILESVNKKEIETEKNDAGTSKRRGRRGRGRGKFTSQRKNDTQITTTTKNENKNDTRFLTPLQKLESAMSQASNFTDYPSDSSNALYSSFMQLFVVIFQAWNGPDSQSFVLICRLLYAYIDHKFSSGASLDAILNEFASFDIAFIFSGLSFLEQFEFIYKLRVDTAMPHFVSDIFASSRLIKVESTSLSLQKQTTESASSSKKLKKMMKSGKAYFRGSDDDDDSENNANDEDDDNENEVEVEEKDNSNSNHSTFSERIIPHIWINANGVLDWKLMHRIMRKIVEIIEFEPGIEFTELAGRLPSISPTDLFSLVDALECDEVLYSIFNIESDPSCDELEKPLFAEEVKSILSPPVDCTMYMYSLAVNMNNPLLKPAVRRNIFPTERCKFNLTLAIEDESIF